MLGVGIVASAAVLRAEQPYPPRYYENARLRISEPPSLIAAAPAFYYGSGAFYGISGALGAPSPAVGVAAQNVTVVNVPSNPKCCCPGGTNDTSCSIPRADGAILFIWRGDCYFSVKLALAAAAGASAVVVGNSDTFAPDSVLTMGIGTGWSPSALPSIFISHNDATVLNNALSSGARVGATFSAFDRPPPPLPMLVPGVYEAELIPGVSWDVAPQCEGWRLFTDSLADVAGAYHALRVSSNVSAVDYICQDPAAVSLIAKALKARTSDAVACGGFTWTVGLCGGVLELSVVGSGGQCACVDAPAMTLRPCMPYNATLYSTWGGVGVSTCSPDPQVVKAEFLTTPLPDDPVYLETFRHYDLPPGWVALPPPVTVPVDTFPPEWDVDGEALSVGSAGPSVGTRAPFGVDGGYWLISAPILLRLRSLARPQPAEAGVSTIEVVWGWGGDGDKGTLEVYAVLGDGLNADGTPSDTPLDGAILLGTAVPPPARSTFTPPPTIAFPHGVPPGAGNATRAPVRIALMHRPPATAGTAAVAPVVVYFVSVGNATVAAGVDPGDVRTVTPVPPPVQPPNEAPHAAVPPPGVVAVAPLCVAGGPFVVDVYAPSGDAAAAINRPETLLQLRPKLALYSRSTGSATTSSPAVAAIALGTACLQGVSAGVPQAVVMFRTTRFVAPHAGTYNFTLALRTSPGNLTIPSAALAVGGVVVATAVLGRVGAYKVEMAARQEVEVVVATNVLPTKPCGTNLQNAQTTSLSWASSVLPVAQQLVEVIPLLSCPPSFSCQTLGTERAAIVSSAWSGAFSSVPDFAALAATRTPAVGRLAEFDVDAAAAAMRIPASEFAVHFNTTLLPRTSGSFRFSVVATAAAWLKIDGAVVCSSTGMVGHGTVALTALRRVSLEVGFAYTPAAGAAPALAVSWAVPGAAEEERLTAFRTTAACGFVRVPSPRTLQYGDVCGAEPFKSFPVYAEISSLGTHAVVAAPAALAAFGTRTPAAAGALADIAAPLLPPLPSGGGAFAAVFRANLKPPMGVAVASAQLGLTVADAGEVWWADTPTAAASALRLVCAASAGMPCKGAVAIPAAGGSVVVTLALTAGDHAARVELTVDGVPVGSGGWLACGLPPTADPSVLPPVAVPPPPPPPPPMGGVPHVVAPISGGAGSCVDLAYALPFSVAGDAAVATSPLLLELVPPESAAGGGTVWTRLHSGRSLRLDFDVMFGGTDPDAGWAVMLAVSPAAAPIVGTAVPWTADALQAAAAAAGGVAVVFRSRQAGPGVEFALVVGGVVAAQGVAGALDDQQWHDATLIVTDAESGLTCNLYVEGAALVTSVPCAAAKVEHTDITVSFVGVSGRALRHGKALRALSLRACGGGTVSSPPPPPQPPVPVAPRAPHIVSPWLAPAPPSMLPPPAAIPAKFTPCGWVAPLPEPFLGGNASETAAEGEWELVAGAPDLAGVAAFALPAGAGLPLAVDFEAYLGADRNAADGIWVSLCDGGGVDPMAMRLGGDPDPYHFAAGCVVGVELDVYNNDHRADAVAGNHIAVMAGRAAAPVLPPMVVPSMQDGAWHSVAFRLAVSEAFEDAVEVLVSFDGMPVVGPSSIFIEPWRVEGGAAYVHFLATTGALYGPKRVRRIGLGSCSASQRPPPPVPPPDAWAADASKCATEYPLQGLDPTALTGYAELVAGTATPTVELTPAFARYASGLISFERRLTPYAPGGLRFAFEFFMGGSDDGADGIWAFISRQMPDVLTGTGGWPDQVLYSGEAVVGVELDTHGQDGVAPRPTEPREDHVAVIRGSSLYPQVGPTVVSNLEDGLWHGVVATFTPLNATHLTASVEVDGHEVVYGAVRVPITEFAAPKLWLNVLGSSGMRTSVKRVRSLTISQCSRGAADLPPASTFVPVPVQEFPRPAAPTGLTVTEVAVGPDESGRQPGFVLTWQPSARVAGVSAVQKYNVTAWRADTATFYPVGWLATAGTTLFYPIASLKTQALQVVFRVRALSAEGASDDVSSDRFAIAGASISPPSPPIDAATVGQRRDARVAIVAGVAAGVLLLLGVVVVFLALWVRRLRTGAYDSDGWRVLKRHGGARPEADEALSEEAAGTALPDVVAPSSPRLPGLLPAGTPGAGPDYSRLKSSLAQGV